MVQHAIQVISLNPNAPAVESLLADITAAGLVPTVFPAVDGRREMPALDDGEVLNQQASLARRFVALTSTEVACYLSHLRAIRQAYHNGVDKLCLLEDDVSLESNFGEVLEAVFALPEEFEFVRLMGLKRHRYKVLRPLAGGVELVSPVKGLCGTQGYVINRRGMEVVLKTATVISEPIDKYYDHFWESGLRCFAVVPHIIWERESPSSVAKLSRRQATVSRWQKLRRPLQKLARSIRRKRYLRRYPEYFSAVQKPAAYLGRAKRIR